MSLTKERIIDSICNSTDLSKMESRQAVESLLEVIKKTLESSEDVLISGFGKFYVKEKNARRGRNPATGNDLTLGARRVVTFKCSGRLRDKINGESDLWQKINSKKRKGAKRK
jgi:integration host factor subunit alpha